MRTVAKKKSPSALMALFAQLGLIYLTGGAAASIVTRSIRPLLVTGVGTVLLHKFFTWLDSMTPA